MTDDKKEEKTYFTKEEAEAFEKKMITVLLEMKKILTAFRDSAQKLGLQQLAIHLNGSIVSIETDLDNYNKIVKARELENAK